MAGSLAAIDQWVQDMSSEDDVSDDDLQNFKEHRVPRKVFTDATPVVPPSMHYGVHALKEKILSRDAIFHMVREILFFYRRALTFFPIFGDSAQIVPAVPIANAPRNLNHFHHQEEIAEIVFCLHMISHLKMIL